uniref:Uncharacterized protein n=1 Tax=Anguilla anguilla TaxID=7936 RepID=A0A0E9UC98_ANGAN
MYNIIKCSNDLFLSFNRHQRSSKNPHCRGHARCFSGRNVTYWVLKTANPIGDISPRKHFTRPLKFPFLLSHQEKIREKQKKGDVPPGGDDRY